MKRFTILMGILTQVLASYAVIIPDEDIIPPVGSTYDYWSPMGVFDNIVYKGQVWDHGEGGGALPSDYSCILGVTSHFDTEDLRLTKLNFYPSPKYAVPYAFENCLSIKTVKFGGCMDTADSYMFKECTNIVSVDMSLMSSDYVSRDFIMVNIREGAFYGCVALSDLKLPKLFDSIGKKAFYGCAKIERIHINEAEYYYPGFNQEWVLGEFKYIDDEAFSGCTGLKYIKLPASLQKIGDNVWTDCVNLEEILYTAEEPLVVDESKGVFPEVVYENATLYLSEEYADTHPDIRDGLGYPWNRFQHIEIMDFSGIDEISSEDSGNSNEIDETLPYEVYTLNGIRVCTNNPIPQLRSVPKGLYILRQGSRSKKVFIP